MKKVIFIAIVAGAMAMESCASQKKSVPDYQYQQQQSQQQQQAQSRPTRTMRAVDPCIELANEDCDAWRAYGTATSYVEKVANNEAIRDARNQLAQMMKVAVEGAAQDYEQNAQTNLKSTASTLGESLMTQFVDEEVKNTRIIKTSIYDLADGSVQVYVCVEMRGDKKEFEKKLENVLDREDILATKYDREQFVKKMSQGLEDYKKRNRENQ